MNSPHGNHTATLLANGTVLVVGGAVNSIAQTNISEIYNSTTKKWANVDSIKNARCYHTATLLTNGKVLVVGGFHYPKSLSSVEQYDPIYAK